MEEIHDIEQKLCHRCVRLFADDDEDDDVILMCT